MTDDQTEIVAGCTDDPEEFFFRIHLYDKKLYEQYLQQALKEIQETLGK